MRSILTTWHQVGEKISLVDLTKAEAEHIIRAVNAFGPLLAVAKAVDARGSHPDTWYGETVEAMVALTAAHPGWREWAP